MSNGIWNNPVMWQTKKSGLDNNTEDLSFDFDFGAEEEVSDPFGLQEKSEYYKDFKKESSVVDGAANAAAYKESSPEMAGGGNPADSLDKELTDIFNPKKPEEKGNTPIILTQQPTYIFNIDLGGGSNSQDIPPLNTLIKNANAPLFEVNHDADDAILDKAGITTDDIYDKGIAIGLSPYDIAPNLDTLRSATALREVTGGNLNSFDLDTLRQASLKGDAETTEMILQDNNINLDDDISTNDIMSLVVASNSPIFKSVYLN